MVSPEQPLSDELSFDCLWLQTADSSYLRLLNSRPSDGLGTSAKAERRLAGDAQQPENPHTGMDPPAGSEG